MWTPGEREAAMTRRKTRTIKNRAPLHILTSATKESGTASEACKKEPASTDELVKIVPSIQTWRDFDQLLMESERELLNIARFFIRYDPGGADAEDIVQQARLKAYEYLKKGEAYAIHSTRLVFQRDFLGYTERKSVPGGGTKCLSWSM